MINIAIRMVDFFKRLRKLNIEDHVPIASHHVAHTFHHFLGVIYPLSRLRKKQSLDIMNEARTKIFMPQLS
jgi:hypothetical protein